MGEAYWYRLHFKLRLYEAQGDAFQRLVADILHARYPGFQAVTPAGRYGDGGNDGFIHAEGRYFQVYGPMLGDAKPAAAVRKLQEDFAKLRQRYPNLRRYSFVMNDRYQGVPANVHDALQALQQATRIACDAVASRELTDWFMALSEDRRQSILQGVPVTLPTWIDQRALGEVLSHLADGDARFDPARERAPEFDEKIRFNHLPPAVADRLRAMSYQCGAIDDFLVSRGQHLAQAIAQELRDLYALSEREIGQGDDDGPGLRYVWMMERIIPPLARAHPHSLKAYREAAEVVLAKYFESCDIYAQPGADGLAP